VGTVGKSLKIIGENESGARYLCSWVKIQKWHDNRGSLEERTRDSESTLLAAWQRKDEGNKGSGKKGSLSGIIKRAKEAKSLPSTRSCWWEKRVIIDTKKQKSRGVGSDTPRGHYSTAKLQGRKTYQEQNKTVSRK